MLIADFTEDPSRLSWHVVDDGVMGGRSRGHVHVAPGRLVFRGETVTAGGGFTSVRSGALPPIPWDTSAFRLALRGDGRGWILRAEDRAGNAWWAGVPPVPEGREAVVDVPLDAFRPRRRGRWLPGGPPDPEAVRGLGLVVSDGRDGPFRLVVRRIEAVRGSADALPGPTAPA